MVGTCWPGRPERGTGKSLSFPRTSRIPDQSLQFGGTLQRAPQICDSKVVICQKDDAATCFTCFLRHLPSL